MGAGPKKKEEPKPEVVAPVVQKVGLKTPEKPKPNRGVKRKIEPPKIVLSPLEVTRHSYLLRVHRDLFPLVELLIVALLDSTHSS